MKLPFTVKNNRRKKSQIWVSKATILDPPKWVFVFWRKPPQKICSSGFGYDSALKTIDAQMFFWSVFLKTHFKELLTVKNAILIVFGDFKNNDQNNICASIVLKAFIIIKNWLTPKKSTLSSFEIKTLKKNFLHIFLLF